MNDDWPALPYEQWKDTYATLHMWSQVVGKVALAKGPPLNHSWGSALRLTSRGFETPVLSHGSRRFTIAFDLVDHHLVIAASDGERRTIPLAPRPVADFYREVMATLDGMGLPVRIWSMPVEIESPIRFEEDTIHHAYDPIYANRVWRILLQVERVLTASRCSFLGKTSPANFFWGAFDLALTRFSGRPAPPREGPAFQRDAYSHEVISHGFWPGGAAMPEPVFYAYAVPEPAGFKSARALPEAAFYHAPLGEFLLPYEAVRQSPSPDEALRAFVDSTYAAGATLAGWDRGALERPA
jgi:hypothetical protein